MLLAGMGLACLIAVFEFIWKSRQLATSAHVRIKSLNRLSYAKCLAKMYVDPSNFFTPSGIHKCQFSIFHQSKRIETEVALTLCNLLKIQDEEKE